MSKLVVKFDDTSTADGNRFAEELQEFIQERDSSITVQRRREDPQAQDFGATLGIVLAAPAVVTLAKGIAAWLSSRPGVTLTLEDDAGRLVARHLDSKNAEAVIRARFGPSAK